MRPRLPIVIAALASCLVALPARADAPTPEHEAPESPAPPSPKDKAEIAKQEAAKAAARLAELIKRGQELCSHGEIDDGLVALEAAWAQHEDPDLAVSLASCEIKASRWPEAAGHLAFALRSKEDPAQRKPLEASFVDVRARVGAVKVTVNVDGADVFVGDRFVGISPLPGEAYVEPGTTRISAKKTGFGEVDGEITVAARGTTALTLDLAGQGAMAQSRRPTVHRSTTPAYVLGVLGVLAGGVGAALYATGAGKGSAADELLAELQTKTAMPCTVGTLGCATLKSLRQSHDTFVNAGTGVLAGSGVLLGTALIYGMWAAFSTPPERVGLTIVPASGLAMSPGQRAPTGGGLVVTGTF